MIAILRTLFTSLSAENVVTSILKNSLKDRFLDHLGYARKGEIKKATGGNFNLIGHSLSDMNISVLESVMEKNTFYSEDVNTGCPVFSDFF